MIKENPLISIMVIAYNSSKTVIETLNSAKEQSYNNIELIISDDCSSDNTVELCNDWLKENSTRFNRTVLITSHINTGVPANLNRAISECKGEWIKGIAADDILLINCIEDNVNYVLKNSTIKILFSNLIKFDEKKSKKNSLNYSMKMLFQKTTEEQFLQIITKGIDQNLSPTIFILTSLIKENPYDERFKYQEDYPKILDLTHKGFRLFYMDKVTVKYRIGNTLSNSIDYFYNKNFIESQILYFYHVKKQYLIEHNLLKEIKRNEKTWFIYFFTIIVLRNKRNNCTRIIRKIVSLIIK